MMLCLLHGVVVVSFFYLFLLPNYRKVVKCAPMCWLGASGAVLSDLQEKVISCHHDISVCVFLKAAKILGFSKSALMLRANEANSTGLFGHISTRIGNCYHIF